MGLEGLAEALAGHVHLLADAGQVGDPHRGAVLFDQLHQGQVVPHEVVTVQLELVLREVEGLLDQVDVARLHRREEEDVAQRPGRSPDDA